MAVETGEGIARNGVPEGTMISGGRAETPDDVPMLAAATATITVTVTAAEGTAEVGVAVAVDLEAGAKAVC
jgi:hypothetical protein